MYRMSTRKIHYPGVVLSLCLLTSQIPAVAAEDDVIDDRPLAFTFSGTAFYLAEAPSDFEVFLPAGQSFQSQWTEMINLILVPHLHTMEQLLNYASKPMEPYFRLGSIVGMSMIRASDERPEAYLTYYRIDGREVQQTSMVKALMHDNQAMFVVYSRRWYGENAKAEHREWAQTKSERRYRSV